MEAIFIEAQRNGYTPKQCGKTLTVGKLRKILAQYDSTTPVYISNDEGYTYGSISPWDIDIKEVNEQ